MAKAIDPERSGNEAINTVGLSHWRHREEFSYLGASQIIFCLPAPSPAMRPRGPEYHVSLLLAGIYLFYRDILIISCLIRTFIIECLSL